MKFYAPLKEPVSLNMTPLIDIVFLLLIFFMTNTTFTKDAVLDITLPTLHTQKAIQESNIIHVYISRQGQYTLNDQTLSQNNINTLLNALTEIQPFDKDTIVLIAADARAPYQEVMRAMDAAGKLGYTRIQLQGNVEGEINEHGNV